LSKDFTDVGIANDNNKNHPSKQELPRDIQMLELQVTIMKGIHQNNNCQKISQMLELQVIIMKIIHQNKNCQKISQLLEL
jgi:hypothetical protein